MWDISFFPPELLLHNYKCGGYVPCYAMVNKHTIVNWKQCLLNRLSKFLIYYFLYLYISFHAYKSTSNDTKGFNWKDLPSWKCEILHVIFTTIHRNYFYTTISVMVTSLVVLRWIHIRLSTEKIPRNVIDDFGQYGSRDDNQANMEMPMY
jgi:hypothetical protein